MVDFREFSLSTTYDGIIRIRLRVWHFRAISANSTPDFLCGCEVILAYFNRIVKSINWDLSGSYQSLLLWEKGDHVVVDEEFLNVCNYSSVCSPIFDFNNFMHVARIHLLSQEKASI